MNHSTQIMLIKPEIRAISTVYEPDVVRDGIVTTRRVRDIYKTLDTSIKKGDLVVVPTSTRHGFTVVKVDDVDVEVNFDDTTEVRWIVAKVDIAYYEKVKGEEAGWIEIMKRAEVRKKREALKASLVELHGEDVQNATLTAPPTVHLEYSPTPTDAPKE